MPRSGGVIPIRVARDTTWQREAAAEQTDPIGPAPGPLARAVLIPAADGRPVATVLVTFAHQITDGSGALRAVQDLVVILAGAPPAPPASPKLPAAQEVLLAELPPTIAPDAAPTASPDAAPDAAPDAEDGGAQPAGEQAAASAPGHLRPFDGSLPIVQVGELASEVTVRLVERARAESCTVQSALCAAAATALAATTGQDQVRINVPIDLRRAAGLDDAVVVRFGATVVVLDHPTGTGFWDLARTAATQLTAARDPGTLQAGARMLASLVPSGPEVAEAAMLGATDADIEITNLGVTEVSVADRDVLTMWGPTMTTQVAGEQILGVVTHGDVLRMVNVTHDRIDGIVDRIVRELDAACR